MRVKNPRDAYATLTELNRATAKVNVDYEIKFDNLVVDCLHLAMCQISIILSFIMANVNALHIMVNVKTLLVNAKAQSTKLCLFIFFFKFSQLSNYFSTTTKVSMLISVNRDGASSVFLEKECSIPVKRVIVITYNV